VTRFFGKFRGSVENNVDPMQLGRVQVRVPAVLGDTGLAWATPCVPYAGPQVGFFAIPPNGANVWVEFEGGDADHPIWAGCFWGTGDVPASPAVAAVKIFKTDAITLQLSDASSGGGLKIEVGPPVVSAPLTLVFDANGIELKNGSSSVKLSASSVSVNGGALEVT
jgi:hypothetical protein